MIAIITTLRYPSRLANRIHVLSMARAFSVLKPTVLYGRSLAVSDTKNLEIISTGFGKTWQNAYRIARDLSKKDPIILYCREPILGIFFILIWKCWYRKNTPLVFEIHDIPHRWYERQFQKSIANRAKKIIVITKALQNELHIQYKIPLEKIIHLPDGVEYERFAKETEIAEELREVRKPIILYSGHLYDWKGVYTLAEAAKKLPDCSVVFVGGKDNDVTALRYFARTISNIYVLGYKKHGEISKYLQAADILILPNTAKIEVSLRFTSPLKLFEYMASGKPIVASRLPSITEILTDGETGYLCNPDDSENLAMVINRVLQSPDQAARIALNAQKYAQQFDWQHRARTIFEMSIHHLGEHS